MLRDDIRSACRRISSLKISYKAEGYDPKKVLAGAYVRRTLIAKAPCSFFLDSAHGYPGLPWEDDLFRQTAYITPTRECNVYPTNRGYFVRESVANAGLPGSLPSEVFFMATGLWPLTGRKPPRPNGYPHMLREVAESDDYSQVRQDQELVDGRWCHVLIDKSHDHLWLDASRGCCLMQREIFDKDSGLLRTRYELRGYHEVSEGIWMPRTIRCEEYDFTTPTKEGPCRKVRDTPIEILEVSVNAVDDGAFQYTPPPGALELDATSILAPARQSKPGGLDHLDDVVCWLNRHSPAPGVPASVLPSRFQAFFPILALSAVLGCELWIRSRRRRAASYGGKDGRIGFARSLLPRQEGDRHVS